MIAGLRSGIEATSAEPGFPEKAPHEGPKQAPPLSDAPQWMSSSGVPSDPVLPIPDSWGEYTCRGSLIAIYDSTPCAGWVAHVCPVRKVVSQPRSLAREDEARGLKLRT